MQKNERGFTLMEMMVAVGLSTMVGMVLFTSVRYGNEQVDTREARMTMQDNAREGMYKMLQELRQSGPSKITVGTGYIQFQIPDPSSLVTTSYAVNWTNAHTIKYSVGGTNNTQLIRQDVTSNKTAVVANNITGLTFSGSPSSAPTVVTATMSIQKTLSNGRVMPIQAMTLTSQAEIRNS